MHGLNGLGKVSDPAQGGSKIPKMRGQVVSVLELQTWTFILGLVMGFIQGLVFRKIFSVVKNND